MSNSFEFRCRLCSATESLISLFSGKCREIRDCIRKLVEVTIGIGFQEGDFHSRICITCVLQTYNFYIFYTKSLQNEEKLKEYDEYYTEKTSKKKSTILDLNDIELPDVTILKKTLEPWLITKQNYCLNQYSDIEYSDSSDQAQVGNHSKDEEKTPNKSITSPICNGNNDKHFENSKCVCKSAAKVQVKKIDFSTQTEGAKLKNQETQCKLKFDQNQNRNIKLNNQGMQCEMVKVDNKLIQCKIKASPSERNKTIKTQTDISNISVKLCDCTNDTIYQNFKREAISPLLSPTKSLSLSLKSETFCSRSPSPLVTEKNVEYVSQCKQCDTITYTKSEMRKHQRIHMKCSLCKKTFTSRKKTLLHTQECELTFINHTPIVRLERLEFTKRTEARPFKKKSDGLDTTHSPKKFKKASDIPS